MNSTDTIKPQPVAPHVSRRFWLGLIVLLIGAALLALYAGRRTPLEPSSGTNINWPADMQVAAKEQIRVATYNIHRGKGKDGVRDLRRTAGVLQGMDIAGLNEVGGVSLIGQADQARQLGLQLHTGWLFAPNQRRWFRDYFGNGLLADVPIGDWTSQPLIYDREKSDSHRNLLRTQIIMGNTPVVLIITHIEVGAIRQDQLREVFDQFDNYPRAILLGDLNTRRDDAALAPLLADAANCDAVGAALGVADLPRRIDWIITRGLSVLGGGMIPAGVSDHPCFWVDLKPAPAE